MLNGKYLLCVVLVAGHTKSKVWQDSTIKSSKEAHRAGLSTGLKNPTGKGKRLIIGHIAWNEVQSAHLPFMPSRIGNANEIGEAPDVRIPPEFVMPRVREGVPPPLCAGRCAAPPTGPVCAFDATGTARTFETICELEAVSCRESTYYAITSLGEC